SPCEGGERGPSRRWAADASRRAALLLLPMASGYDSSSRLARRALRPPSSVRGFINNLSRDAGSLAPELEDDQRPQLAAIVAAARHVLVQERAHRLGPDDPGIEPLERGAREGEERAGEPGGERHGEA